MGSDDTADGTADDGAADAPAEGTTRDDAPLYVPLGRITAHYGLNGWLKIHSDTDPRENITSYPRWWLRRGRGGWRRIDVLDGRAQGKTIVARLDGIHDRDDATPLIGSEIAVRRDELPPVPPGEHYWTDLVGLEVVTLDGASLGTVTRLFETGANDVVVVGDGRTGAKPGSEILIPWVRPDVVTDVDTARGRITVDWDPDY